MVVDRTTKATEKDLQLPFYAGAQVVQSYTYRASTKAGKQLSYYAMAALTTKDSPEKVAKSYAAQTPRQAQAGDTEGQAGHPHRARRHLRHGSALRHHHQG